MPKPKDKKDKKRPRTIQAADAAHKFFRRANIDVNYGTDVNAWKLWSEEDFALSETRHKARKDAMTTKRYDSVSRRCWVQDTMAMTYVYLIQEKWDLATEYYRQVILCCLPTDTSIEPGFLGYSDNVDYTSSDVICQFIQHYDTLLSFRDGRTPCKNTLKKYKKMLFKCDVGTLGELTYPIPAKLRNSKTL